MKAHAARPPSAGEADDGERRRQEEKKMKGEDEGEEDFMSDAVLDQILAAAAAQAGESRGGGGGGREPETYSARRRRLQNERDERTRAGSIRETPSRAEHEREARQAALSENLIDRELQRRATASGQDDIGGGDADEFVDAQGQGGGPSKRRRLDGQPNRPESSASSSVGPSAALKMMLSMGYQHGHTLGSRPSDDDKKRDAEEAAGQRGVDPAVASVGSSDSASKKEHEHRLEPLGMDDRWLASGSKDRPLRFGLGNSAVVQRILRGTGSTGTGTSTSSQEASSSQDTAALDTFRSRRAEEDRMRHAETLLRSARRTCEHLDRKRGVQYSVLWIDPSWLRPEARPTEDELELLEQAFGDGCEPPSVQPEASEVADRQARRQEAEEFCILDAVARLSRTTAHLRSQLQYCLFCGCAYNSEEDMQAHCPGELEDDH
ncbi:hypothetical protein OC834_006846 [Tilletia horrida]|nr:hypothetical protein OC834_006846 [Tilletia horrida]